MMRTSVPRESRWRGPPIALFFEQSLAWGLICLDTLHRLRIPCHLLKARDIRDGCLERYRVLVVPGGWASHKARILGDEGRERIRHFVEGGGSYMGFCGGAGLALSSPSALGLVPLRRMPFLDRLQNASGEVWIQGVANHPAWKDLPSHLPASIWWPSQFSPDHMEDALCLATYHAPGSDFWVADLPVADLTAQNIPWEEHEKVYGINLNPSKILGHPAIVEVRAGKGRLVLSYPHLETPDDLWGNRLFANLLRHLDAEASRHRLHGSAGFYPPHGESHSHPQRDLSALAEQLAEPFQPCLSPGGRSGKDMSDGAPPGSPPSRKTLDHLIRAQETVEDFVAFGERHLFWKWRRPWLLQWRRGIRGLEYSTLALLVRTVVAAAREICGEGVTEDPWEEPAQQCEQEIVRFCKSARSLLLEEKLSAQAGKLTKLGKVNETVDELREELFGRSMNHGGLARTVFDKLDGLLVDLLRQQMAMQAHRAKDGSFPQHEVTPFHFLRKSNQNK